MDAGSNGTPAGRSKPDRSLPSLALPFLENTGPMCVFTS